MTGIAQFHVGIVVADLESAMAELSSLLGLTFNEPRTVYFNRLEDPDPREADIRVVFSKEGPPHYELMQGGPGTVYENFPLGLHHVGVWQRDAQAKLDDFAARGIPFESRVVMPDGRALSWFNDPDSILGVRFEFVDDADRPTLENFMRTGEYEGEFRV